MLPHYLLQKQHRGKMLFAIELRAIEDFSPFFKTV